MLTHQAMRGWVLLLCASGCATVPSGFAAVITTPAGVRPRPLGEGMHVVPPLSRVDLFDLRGQERSEDLHALTADGAPVLARASLVMFRLIPGELVAFDRQLGPRYYEVLVRPVVRSSLRRILGARRADQLDSAAIPLIQDEVTKLAAERLRPFHVELDAVDLRTLMVELSKQAYSKIVDAGVLDQRLKAQPQLLAVARDRARARQEVARSIAAAHALVAPTLTPEVLNESARRAERALLTAPSTRVIWVSPGQLSTVEVVP